MLQTFSKKILFNKKGMSLIELIAYIALFSIITLAVTNALFGISQTFARVVVNRELITSGGVAMETMIYEIRNATSLVTSSSTLGVNPSTLTITGLLTDGVTSYTETFSVVNGRLVVSRDGGQNIPLTSASHAVTNFSVYGISSGSVSACKITLVLTDIKNPNRLIQQFDATAIMRGTFQ